MEETKRKEFASTFIFSYFKKLYYYNDYYEILTNKQDLLVKTIFGKLFLAAGFLFSILFDLATIIS